MKGANVNATAVCSTFSSCEPCHEIEGCADVVKGCESTKRSDRETTQLFEIV